ncbi:aldo/keto reductase [Paraliomyxa miuraensis]|uniref:aldo/keto reductase n=1 Tax=Paraliomyxa miuraensis TaxID=376150 RepID=UPI00225011E4|nr:aldo/keto reductase [Paraliomyxa miuraensis]MCX4247425.1 aldo/keto reductase [Paraliomyxa miuraensis]
MRTLTLRHSGLELSHIIAGGWQAGRDLWVGIDDDESVAALRAAFEAGITTFDTAEDYGAGHSERILARALGDHRDAIVIATKVSWDHLRRDQIMEACERSLQNLGTDVIDLYQIHWPAGTFGSPRVPLEESMEALERLRQQGKIRAIGVSNFDLDQLRRACALGPVDALQPPYSLLWRQAERELLPSCREHGIAVLAYSPLAQGLLTGAFGPDHRLEEGDNRVDNRLWQAPVRAQALAIVEAMRPLAHAHGLSLAKLALAWVAGRPGVAAIVGARTPAQARENAAAGDVIPTPRLRAQLDELTADLAQNDEPVMWTWST